MVNLSYILIDNIRPHSKSNVNDIIALYWRVAVIVINLFSILHFFLKNVTFTNAFKSLSICLLL